MTLAHFYHLYAAGAWEDPAREHFEALDAAKYPGRVWVGLVGSPGRRSTTVRWLNRFEGYAAVCALQDEGWEQATLQKLYEYAQTHNGAVMYAHTKGAHNPAEINVGWRRYMTRHLVGRWEEALGLLDSVDMAGPCCVMPGDMPGVITPFFAGNFWMATCEYIRRLPPPGMESRYDAEVWPGLASPSAASLAPFTPGLWH